MPQPTAAGDLLACDPDDPDVVVIYTRPGKPWPVRHTMALSTFRASARSIARRAEGAVMVEVLG